MQNDKTFSSSFMSNKNGDVRAMFYNIYGWMWYPDKENSPNLSSGPIELRQKLQAEMISSYAPDVLGMQEYSIYYHKGMTPRLFELG